MKCPAQKEVIMEAMDTKSDDKPIKSFLGRSLPKTFSWCRDVSMARNYMFRELTEMHRAINDETANSCNDVWFSRVWFAAPAVCAARKGGGAGESDSGDEGRHNRTRRRCAPQPVPAGFDQLLVGFGEDLLWRLAVLVRP